jgi:hypothetical protein
VLRVSQQHVAWKACGGCEGKLSRIFSTRVISVRFWMMNHHSKSRRHPSNSRLHSIPSTPRSYKRSLSFRFPYQNTVSLLLHSCYVPDRVTLLDSIARMVFREQCKSRSSSVCIFLQSPVISTLCRPGRPQSEEQHPAPADATYIGYRIKSFEFMYCRIGAGRKPER